MKNQVKVKQTEIYKDLQGEHIVCKGRLVLIPNKNELNKTPLGEIDYKPIIISETEEIEVGDNIYHNTGPNKGKIDICRTQYSYTIFNKVLALPENFSPKHLQAIIDGKLKDGDEVYIECFESERYEHDDIGEYPVSENIINLTNNHIKLFPINKEESWDNIFKIIYDNSIGYKEMEKYLKDNYLPPKRK